MGIDLYSWIAGPIAPQILGRETLVHLAMALPENDFNIGLIGDISPQILIRQENDPFGPKGLHDINRVGRGAADV